MITNMACPRHRTLVSQVLNGEPTEADIDRFDAEVVPCPDCMRALAAVHQEPVLKLVPPSRAASRALARRVLHGAERSRAPRRVATAVLAAAAIAAAWVIAGASAPVSAGIVEPTTDALAIPVAEPVSAIDPPVPTSEPRGVRPSSMPAVPPAPSPRLPAASVNDDGRQGRERVAGSGRVAPPSAPDAGGTAPADGRSADGGDAAVVVESVDLAGGDLRKGGGGGGASLVATRDLAKPGELLGLSIVSSAKLRVVVCATGPEDVVVWRGSVPAGTTRLRSGDGELVEFRVEHAGTYRFLLAAGDDPACAKPLAVEVVEVEP